MCLITYYPYDKEVYNKAKPYYDKMIKHSRNKDVPESFLKVYAFGELEDASLSRIYIVR